MSQAVSQSEPSKIPTADELGFDPGALREQYAAERTKRLRTDANNQYQEITGQFAHYNVDPYVEPGFTRAVLSAAPTPVVTPQPINAARSRGVARAARAASIVARVTGAATAPP